MAPRVGRPTTVGGRWWLVLGLASAFVALAASVRLGVLDGCDSTVRAWARSGDVWGATRMRADYVVEGLRPPILAGLLVAFTAIITVVQRSLRPATFVVGVAMLTGAVTVAAKAAVGRLIRTE
jgi:hypothetical protein